MELAQALLNQNLAACVNLLPGVTSVYRWQEQICSDQEVQMLIKTDTNNLTTLATTIKQLHPYEVPEIIALPIEWGDQPYMEWLKRNC